MAKLDQESWQQVRDKMLKTCQQCHLTSYTKEQLDMGDFIMMRADRLMAEAITMVAVLYEDGIIEKPANYLPS